MQHADNPVPGDCFLCAGAAKGVDRVALVVYRDDLAVVMMNIYPYNNGHLLVAPVRHIGELSQMTADEARHVNDVVRRAVEWLQAAYRPDGFNLGMNLGRVAGAGLPGHLHIHIVPRWNGDTNFMPVTAATKVLSEALKAGWERLRKEAGK